MNLSMKIINGDEAVKFLRSNYADKEHVAIDSEGHWHAFVSGRRIVGVGAIRKVRSVWRVKGLFVKDKYRGRGLGSIIIETLLRDIENSTDGSQRITTFSTDMSDPIFKKNGFSVKRVNKNEISFMEKEIVNHD